MSRFNLYQIFTSSSGELFKFFHTQIYKVLKVKVKSLTERYCVLSKLVGLSGLC